VFRAVRQQGPHPLSRGKGNPAQRRLYWSLLVWDGCLRDGLLRGEGARDGAQSITLPHAGRRELAGVCTVSKHGGTELYSTNIISNLGQHQFLN